MFCLSQSLLKWSMNNFVTRKSEIIDKEACEPENCDIFIFWKKGNKTDLDS